jgi:hypothetical protein
VEKESAEKRAAMVVLIGLDCNTTSGELSMVIKDRLPSLTVQEMLGLGQDEQPVSGQDCDLQDIDLIGPQGHFLA